MFDISRKIGRLALAASAAFLALTLATQAGAADPSWLDKNLLAKAKKEGGTLTVYGSMHEEEALPFWKIFDKITGLKTSYVRASDVKLMGRITVERRAGKKTWDILQTTAVNKLPKKWVAKINPPLAKDIPKIAKDPNKRWYGVYANYNSPAYNTAHVKKSDLPKTYDDFLKHPEWKGKIVIEGRDNEWFYAMSQYYGEMKAAKLLKRIMKELNVKLAHGHGTVATNTASGEYWISLNNYVNLTERTKLHGSPIDWWTMNPIAVFYGQAGVASNAPHPNTALLGVNYLLSQEGQTQLAKSGRIPTRKDVTPTPKDAFERFADNKVVPAVLSSKEDKAWQRKFNKATGRRSRH